MSLHEAAERLRNQWRADNFGEGDVGLLDEALATERRLTVEKVREALLDALHVNVWNSCEAVVISILDDLATADVDEEEGNG